MLPEKPKDKWINAKNFSWFFDYDPDYTVTEEEWYSSTHISNGMIMQALADEADFEGLVIVKCQECIHCRYVELLGYQCCCRLSQGTEGVIFKVDPTIDCCSKGTKSEVHDDANQ